MTEQENFAKLVKETRTKLKLTQKELARYTGGGVNAISRYERGEVVPVKAVINLIKLLHEHPETFDIIK